MSQAMEVRADEALPAAPAANLTPMQMAYQLVQSGRDFAAVREMLDYSRELAREEAEVAFNRAMTAAQGEMGVVATNASNPQTRSRYADYAQLDRVLRPIYRKHGFALSFNDGETDKVDWVRIECRVSHTGGHTRLYHKDMPADGKGAKGNDVMTKTHAVGAAQSYGMRYLLRMIFNVATGEEDRDGNRPVNRGETISQEQVRKLLDLIEATGTDAEAFCKVAKIEAVPDLLAADYERAAAWLTARQNARSGK